MLVPASGAAVDQRRTALAAHLLETSLTRLRVEQELADLSARVDNAQQLAGMGDYDWHIPTDTNRWSDQLYRIYGYEPQAFNASYDKFLAHIHPEDRDRIVAVHQHAYATGEPYQMIERIVRPDGEVRYLSSNGQVLTDETGSPVRMRGTCIDITERVLAEKAQEEIAASLREADLRRRQALQINDNVVQGLTTALYALEMGELATSTSYLQRTLSAARKMIDDLVAPLAAAELSPGDLVRTTASGLEEGAGAPQSQATESQATES